MHVWRVTIVVSRTRYYEAANDTGNDDDDAVVT